MKFKYLDKVMIKDGFYDKVEGIIFGYDNATASKELPEHKYAVSLTSSNQIVWFHEDKLEKFS